MRSDICSSTPFLVPRSQPRSYVVDLDLPPRQRWAHVVRDNIDLLDELVHAYDVALKEEFGCLAPLANALAGMVSVPPVFKEEMEGLAEASGGKLSYGLVARLNIGYDFVAKCTSAGVKVHDTLYHLRNMDWDMPILKKLTVLVRFTKKGRTVHQGITWVGFVGTYTQMAAAGYSISLNFRKVGSSDLVHIGGALACRRQSIGFVVRLLLEEELPYDAFVAKLLAAPLIAPCYLTVVGTDKAMVVTRGKIVAEEVRSLEPCTGGAVVIQTNHDPWRTKEHNRFFLSDAAWPRWAADDELLLNTRDRYACAMQGVRAVVADLGSQPAKAPEGPDKQPDARAVEQLRRVLCTPPVFNSQTVYGVIMVPALQQLITVN